MMVKRREKGLSQCVTWGNIWKKAADLGAFCCTPGTTQCTLFQGYWLVQDTKFGSFSLKYFSKKCFSKNHVGFPPTSQRDKHQHFFWSKQPFLWKTGGFPNSPPPCLQLKKQLTAFIQLGPPDVLVLIGDQIKKDLEFAGKLGRKSQKKIDENKVAWRKNINCSHRGSFCKFGFKKLQIQKMENIQCPWLQKTQTMYTQRHLRFLHIDFNTIFPPDCAPLVMNIWTLRLCG